MSNDVRENDVRENDVRENDVREKVLTMLEDFLEEDSKIKEMGCDDDLSVIGVNSVTFMRLVVAAEMEFDIEWDDEELDFENFSTINKITNYILRTTTN